MSAWPSLPLRPCSPPVRVIYSIAKDPRVYTLLEELNEHLYEKGELLEAPMGRSPLKEFHLQPFDNSCYAPAYNIVPAHPEKDESPVLPSRRTHFTWMTKQFEVECTPEDPQRAERLRGLARDIREHAAEVTWGYAERYSRGYCYEFVSQIDVVPGSTPSVRLTYVFAFSPVSIRRNPSEKDHAEPCAGKMISAKC